MTQLFCRQYEKLLKSKEDHEQKVTVTMRKVDSISQTMESVNKQRKQYKTQIKKEEEKLVELKKVRLFVDFFFLLFAFTNKFSYRNSATSRFHRKTPLKLPKVKRKLKNSPLKRRKSRNNWKKIWNLCKT